jgi:hypothetical protein
MLQAPAIAAMLGPAWITMLALIVTFGPFCGCWLAPWGRRRAKVLARALREERPEEVKPRSQESLI